MLRIYCESFLQNGAVQVLGLIEKVSLHGVKRTLRSVESVMFRNQGVLARVLPGGFHNSGGDRQPMCCSGCCEVCGFDRLISYD